MDVIRLREAMYLSRHLREVKHVTLNPNGPGVVRIHMVPPKLHFNKRVPCVIILNGQDILPINLSWAILLASFIDEVTVYDGKEIGDGEWDALIGRAVGRAKKVYPVVDKKELAGDLWRIINTLTDVAYGRKPEEDIGLISIGDYAGFMKAPHRMDLMISTMAKDGRWNCNQQCVHCYAAGQSLSEGKELSTHEWRSIIDKCRKAGIPQLTFTGGEPTLREDLVELIDHSKWFITRLNTNGVCLTESLCERLYNASLDSVQVTLYSADPEEHNALVGAPNWNKTVNGIRNALNAHLSVSVNTPLCSMNRDYVRTLKFLHELGVSYVSCSGLILTGSARTEKSVLTRLGSDELYSILKEACDYCKENHMEINFTSPGWLEEERLREIGLTMVPTCGACLSNMAVAPDGKVIPCQSWLSDEALGNMLTDPWKQIWESRRCREIRNTSSRMERKCQLRGKRQGECDE